MNKQRRASLNKLQDRLTEARESIETAVAAFQELIAEYKAELEGYRDEEQEYFGNMPESLQGGEKGSAAEEAVASMDSAISELDEIESIEFDASAVERAFEFIEEAKGAA